jgi:hypothetical protein
MPAKKQTKAPVKKVANKHNKKSPSKATQKSSTSRKTPTRRIATYRERIFESDSSYLLKLVIVALLGTVWLKFQSPVDIAGLPLYALPVGLILGILVVKYFEEHQSNRKIWYAVLLVIGIMSYFLPAGIVI